MKTAEQFFRDKAFPVGISDEDWLKWKHSHKGKNWQGFSIKSMEEYAKYYLQQKLPTKEQIEPVIEDILDFADSKSDVAFKLEKWIKDFVLAITPNEVQK